MCKRSDTITSLFIALLQSDISHTHAHTHMYWNPTWHPCPPVRDWHVLLLESISHSRFSFNWLQLSPRWVLCLTADMVMVYHGNCGNTYSSGKPQRNTSALPEPHSCPLWTPIVEVSSSNHTILTGWGHDNESTVCWVGFYHYFCLCWRHSKERRQVNWWGHLMLASRDQSQFL